MKFTRSIFNAAFECPKWAAELEAWWIRYATTVYSILRPLVHFPRSKILGWSPEEPPELKRKRKRTALALFK